MGKVNVLVVDDASFIRDLVKKGLRDNFPGIQIEEAINGRKAQVMLSRTAMDLILCDWEMPEMFSLFSALINSLVLASFRSKVSESSPPL